MKLQSALAAETDGSTLADRIREILPAISGNTSEAESGRQMPLDSVEMLRQAGVFRALVPECYGGDETDFIEFLEALRLLSSGCVSSGWFAGVAATHAHGITYYPRSAQDEIWADGPDTVISSSFAPRGVGKAVEGGYLVNGTWDYSSGADHAQWVQLGFRVDGEEGLSYLGLLPRADYEIIDNWHTVGLRGTGSKRIVVKDIFVPEHRCWGPGLLAPSLAPGLHDNWIYRIPFIFTATNFVAVVLGAADGAVEAYRSGLTARKRAHTDQPRIDNPLAYVRLAESATDLRAATALARQHWNTMVHSAKTGSMPDMDEMTMARADEAVAVRMAIHAVDRLMDAAGGGALRSEHALQRFWRDIHNAGAHAWFDLENKLVIVGRHMVGLPPDPHIF